MILCKKIFSLEHVRYKQYTIISYFIRITYEHLEVLQNIKIEY